MEFYLSYIQKTGSAIPYGIAFLTKNERIEIFWDESEHMRSGERSTSRLKEIYFDDSNTPAQDEDADILKTECLIECSWEDKAKRRNHFCAFFFVPYFPFWSGTGSPYSLSRFPGTCKSSTSPLKPRESTNTESPV